MDFAMFGDPVIFDLVAHAIEVLAESPYPVNNAETRRVEAEGEARVHDAAWH